LVTVELYALLQVFLCALGKWSALVLPAWAVASALVGVATPMASITGTCFIYYTDVTFLQVMLRLWQVQILEYNTMTGATHMLGSAGVACCAVLEVGQLL
jgi:hypothetical protein